MPLPQDNFAVLFFTRGESRPPKVRVSRGDLTGGSSWQPSGCIRIGQKEIVHNEFWSRLYPQLSSVRRHPWNGCDRVTVIVS